MKILTKPQVEDIQYMESMCLYVLGETYLSYDFRIFLVKFCEKRIRSLIHENYVAKWSLASEEDVLQYDNYVMYRRGLYSESETLDRKKKLWDILNFEICLD